MKSTNYLNWEENICKCIKDIAQKYPHPLEWTTTIHNTKDGYIATNFFPNAVYKWSVEEDDILVALKDIKSDIEKLSSFRNNVNDHSLLRIDEIINWLNMLKYAIYIEAEKGWYKLWSKEKKYYHSKVLEYSTKLYWESISENKKEVNIVSEHLEFLIKNWINRLDKDELNELKDLLRILNLNIDLSKKNNDNKDLNNEEKFNENLTKKINAENLKEIFEIVFSIYWIKEEIYITSEKDFIDIWENGNFIPKNWKWTVKRALELISHEIETHTLRSVNNNNRLRSKWYLILEEGLAILNEFSTWLDYEDLDTSPTFRFICIQWAENLEEEKLKRYLYLLLKISWKSFDEKTIYKQVRRLKRYHPYDRPWANRKDVIYYRGFLKVYNIFKRAKNKNEIQLKLKKMLSWKNSFSDFSTQEINDNIILPYWIWRIIFKKLSWEEIFYDSLKRKDSRFFDISNDEIDRLPTEIKKKILKIIQIIEKS